MWKVSHESMTSRLVIVTCVSLYVVYLMVFSEKRISDVFAPKVRDISHENLNPFIGACIESPNILLVWSYCKKGSLQVSLRI